MLDHDLHPLGPCAVGFDETEHLALPHRLPPAPTIADLDLADRPKCRPGYPILVQGFWAIQTSTAGKDSLLSSVLNMTRWSSVNVHLALKW